MEQEKKNDRTLQLYKQVHENDFAEEQSCRKSLEAI